LIYRGIRQVHEVVCDVCLIGLGVLGRAEARHAFLAEVDLDLGDAF